MGFKLYNRGSDGFPAKFPIGGLKVYNTDLWQLETNSQLFGVYSILKQWNCILSGCYVDDLDLNTKKLSLTEGLVLIDGKVYQIPRLENQTYPFAIIPGTENIDQRTFKDGSLKNVAIEYNHSITTSFTYDNIANNYTRLYPNNLSNGIYFDPFTAQRAEYILENSGKSVGEIKTVAPLQGEVSTPFNIIQTETGKQIQGGSLSAFDNFYKGSGDRNYSYSTIYGRWKYFGFINYSQQQDDRMFINYSNDKPFGSTGGRERFRLRKENIPTHEHDNGSLQTSSSGNHKHTITTNQDNWNESGGGVSFTQDGGDEGVHKHTDWEGWHTHTITGNTGDGSESGLKQTPDLVDIMNPYLAVLNLQWKGYANFSQSARFQFFKGTINQARY